MPNVLQAAEVWMSDVDIEAGMRGIHEIFSQLESARVGVICLTPENLTAPWLLFEAGAISKQMNDKTRVCPYLLSLSPSEIPKPIAEFQAVTSDEEGTRKLMRTINKSLDRGGLADDMLNRAFDVWWPELRESLDAMKREDTVAPPQPEIAEQTSEILGSVREILRRLDQDRAFYLSADAIRQEIAAAKEVRSELVREQNERMQEALADPSPFAEAIARTMQTPQVKEAVATMAREKMAQMFSAISLSQPRGGLVEMLRMASEASGVAFSDDVSPTVADTGETPSTSDPRKCRH